MLQLITIAVSTLEVGMIFRKSLTILVVVLVFGLCVVGVAQRREAGLSKYYKEWLEKDVVYIISEDERSFFKALKNDEERESFIQQFWDRRNPDPRSEYNEFKEEHYRRIAYANQQFTSGVPGWRTDRGRIYITLGPPDDRETHATGGIYYRSEREGGGSTSRYPWEKWWYRHIDNVGDGIELLFSDSSISGEYRLVMYEDELDALLHVEGMGLTLAEQMGLSEKRDRAYFNPSGWYDPNNPNPGSRVKDAPFTRMEQYFNVQRPPKIKFDDLKSVVTTNITFSSLAFDVRTDYIRLSEDKVLVPITVEINNSELEFKKDKEFNRAKINVYGIVTGLTNKILAEWEDEVVRDFNDIYFYQAKEKRSTYQRLVLLPPGQRYKMDLVLKDVNSKKVGYDTLSIVVPKFTDPGLQSSSIILTNNITPAPASATSLEQYVIGDLRVVPNVMAEYVPGDKLVPYMQIYGMEIDQTTQNPSLDVEFVVKKGNEVLEVVQNDANNSEQYFYGQRVVLVGRIPVGERAPGKYQLEIRVLDKISNNRLTATKDFTVNEPAPLYVDEEE